MDVVNTETIGKMSLRAILPIGGAGFAPPLAEILKVGVNSWKIKKL
jgi:hypothetical protein